jgi:hypothetical protein
MLETISIKQNGATAPALIAPKGPLLSIIAAPGFKAPGQPLKIKVNVFSINVKLIFGRELGFL